MVIPLKDEKKKKLLILFKRSKKDLIANQREFG